MSETIISIPKALVSFTTCNYCMGELVSQVDQYGNVKFNHGKVVLKDFDHVYGRMLIKGQQNLVQISCPHLDLANQRYYIRGKTRVHLGQKMVKDIYHYHNAGLFLNPSYRVRSKLIKRYGYLRFQNDSDLSDWSTDEGIFA